MENPHLSASASWHLGLQSAKYLATLYKPLPSPTSLTTTSLLNRESCPRGADSGSVPFLRSGQEIACPVFGQSSDYEQGRVFCLVFWPRSGLPAVKLAAADPGLGFFPLRIEILGRCRLESLTYQSRLEVGLWWLHTVCLEAPTIRISRSNSRIACTILPKAGWPSYSKKERVLESIRVVMERFLCAEPWKGECAEGSISQGFVGL